MVNKYDLHIHSQYSDGTDSPKEILDKALDLGIKTISITDHDTIYGVKEAKEYGKKIGINVISGVELSTYSIAEVHILGYCFDENDKKFCEALDSFSLKRKERVQKILKALEKYKVFIKEEDLPKSNSIGRLHVANALLEKGYVTSIPEAFDRYLGVNGCAYFPSMRLTPLEGVKLIKEAGGIPVIAHPLRFLQRGNLEDLIQGLKTYGLGGLEVYYNTHDDLICAELYKLANKYKLIATGGTDYHGKNRNLMLGSVEYDLDDIAKKALRLK